MASLQDVTVNSLNVVGTNDVMPVGSRIPFFGSSVPTGWLLCDGSAVSRTTYANLFSAIGTTHGSGDGSTTFNLPDEKGVVPIGKADSGTASVYNETGGSFNHTHSGYSHTHGLNSHYHTVAHTHSIPAHSHTISHTHTLVAHSHPMPHTHSIGSHSHSGTTGTASGSISISTVGTRACATDNHTHTYTTNSVSASSGQPNYANTSDNLTAEVTNGISTSSSGDSTAGTSGASSITNSAIVTGFTSSVAPDLAVSNALTMFVNYIIKY